MALPLVWQFALSDGKAAKDALFLFSVVATGLWMAVGYFDVRRPAWLRLGLFPLYAIPRLVSEQNATSSHCQMS